MVTADKLKKVFSDKLQATGDMDEAFRKAIWIAYTEGLLEGLNTKNPQNIVPQTEAILAKAYGESLQGS